MIPPPQWKVKHDIEKILDFILCYVLLKIVLLRDFVNLLHKIQFNNLCMNMWLSSLNIFQENQFFEIKRKNI